MTDTYELSYKGNACRPQGWVYTPRVYEAHCKGWNIEQTQWAWIDRWKTLGYVTVGIEFPNGGCGRVPSSDVVFDLPKIHRVTFSC